jgi:3-isopropylmalate/(R)-2-methylmalate dehydratase large subunit
MGMTIAEKILAAKSGRDVVRPGEIVTCKIDRLMLDSIDPDFCAAIDDIGITRAWDPDRVIIIHDHEVPPASIGVANMYAESRRRAKRFGITHFFDMGNHGICHQFFVENGFALPGQLIVGNDSHTTTYGALNAASRGILQEVPFVFAKGELWFRVPDTVRVALTGQLSEWVTSKDIVLHVAGRYNFNPFLNRSIEYSGQGLRDLSLAGRMVLSNMAVDLGAKFAISEFDAVTAAFLAGRAIEGYKPVVSDADAPVAASLELSLGDIRPLVAHPDGLFNVSPAAECKGIRIDQAFLGTCTNGRLEDLQLAAKVLLGRKIAKHVRMIVTPASQAIFREMARSGLMETFLEAGAVVTNSTCGACMGLSMGVLGDDEVCISSGSRNFKGRMGSTTAQIYLASPATVAASAVAGEIADPDALR